MTTRQNYVIERRAEDAGKTPAQYLEWLFTQHSKLESAAMEVGMTHVGLLAAMKRHGVTRRRSCDFEYNGHVDSLTGHCKRFCLNFNNTSKLLYRNHLTGAQALDRARAI